MSYKHHIEASFDTLFIQATDNAGAFTRSAIRATENLPKGVDRTAVIVAYINAAASDWRTSGLTVGLQKLESALDEVGRQIGRMAEE
jgi:hypothetical protein